LIDAFTVEVRAVVGPAVCGSRYLAIQQVPGVGPMLAAVFVAGFPDAVSWAGLTPRHRESDTTVRRGPITK
jgi:transposase